MDPGEQAARPLEISYIDEAEEDEALEEGAEEEEEEEEEEDDDEEEEEEEDDEEGEKRSHSNIMGLDYKSFYLFTMEAIRIP